MIAWEGLGTRSSPDGDLAPIRPRHRDEPSALRAIAEIPLLLAVAAVIAIVVKAFVAQAFFIPSASMEPQLASGDRVVVSRIAYELHEPRRGDIVVFDDPLQVGDEDDSFVVARWGRDALEALGLVEPADKELIKRVIALEGETVRSAGGTIYVDDRVLREPYLDAATTTSDFSPYTVPEGHVFVLGDNRGNSKDSRVFEAVPVDSIVGRAIARVWPPARIAFL